ncbi:hypothetical protein L3X38_024692 [Prunus dulcis]|uniref:Reverse transcriptase domain-containing protein n=1 Tax=Prunus dulcis TaxID=3755 RepID=A0AAD4W0A0_PRUDU|nr:hypothetical protein L3X38_024692 [Prunus dulcis]
MYFCTISETVLLGIIMRCLIRQKTSGTQVANQTRLPSNQTCQKNDVYGNRTKSQGRDRKIAQGVGHAQGSARIPKQNLGRVLSNIVPVLKRKTGAVRISVDNRNLNEASPEDEYPMPIEDILVDEAAHNKMLSFMDGNAGYNQIMVAEEDIHKTAFMCPRHISAFEYTIMPFGLRNAGATYQRAMNCVFHDIIGHSLQVYIDYVVIKSP